MGLKNGLARRFLPSEELQGNAVRDLDHYQVPPCDDARCSVGSRLPKSHAAAGWYHCFLGRVRVATPTPTPNPNPNPNPNQVPLLSHG